MEFRPSAFTYLVDIGGGRRRGGGGGGAGILRPRGPGRGADVQMRQPLIPQNQPQLQNVPAPPPPPEEAIETLMAMGFHREAVVRVLQQCDNNVEVAANRLLGG